VDLNEFLLAKTPENFLRLVRSHLVEPVFGVPDSSADVHFQITDFGAATLGQMGRDAACRHLKIRRVDGAAADTVRGYLCGYRAGLRETGQVGQQQVTVGGDRDYMFTPTMNGCTFVVGRRHEDGARLVAHFNLQAPDTAAMATAEMDEAARALFGGGDSIDASLRHDHYRKVQESDNNLLQSMTFGLRIGGEWRFYYQIFSTDHKQYGVFRLA
jgi:hypothetical protein